MLEFFKKLVSGVESDIKKVELLLTAHKDIIEGLVEWTAKEYVTLGGSDKMAKAINLIESLLKLPVFVQAVTPEVLSTVEQFIQKSYDSLKASGKI